MPDEHDPSEEIALRHRLAELQAELSAVGAELARLAAPSVPNRVPAPAPIPIPAPAPRQSGLRRVVLGAYSVIRPVVRPLAHRGRRFFTGELMAELHLLRGRQDEILTRLVALEPAEDGGPAVHLARVAEQLLLTLALESRRP